MPTLLAPRTTPFNQGLIDMLASLADDPSIAKAKALAKQFHKDPTARTLVWVSYLNKTPRLDLKDLKYLLKVMNQSNLFVDITGISLRHNILTDEAYAHLLGEVLLPSPAAYPADKRVMVLESLKMSPRFSMAHPAVEVWIQSLWTGQAHADEEISVAAWAADLFATLPGHNADWTRKKVPHSRLPLIVLTFEVATRRRLLKSVIPGLSDHDLHILVAFMAETARGLFKQQPGRVGDLKALLPVLRPALIKNPKILAPWFTSPEKAIREASINIAARVKQPLMPK